MDDDTQIELESVANVLRGMYLDRRIPEDARDVLLSQANRLDAILEDFGDDLDEDDE